MCQSLSSSLLTTLELFQATIAKFCNRKHSLRNEFRHSYIEAAGYKLSDSDSITNLHYAFPMPLLHVSNLYSCSPFIEVWSKFFYIFPFFLSFFLMTERGRIPFEYTRKAFYYALIFLMFMLCSDIGQHFSSLSCTLMC